MSHYLYLHGFASSPQSRKAVYLQAGFQRIGIPLSIPDLNQGDFTHLTMTRQILQVATDLPPDAVTLIGSSLGGLVAAWVAEHHPQVQRLILLAPAFGFLEHWLGKLGSEQLHSWQQNTTLPVFHYGENRRIPLQYDFIEDARQYRDNLLQRPLPTLILHGIHDEVIPISASQAFASQRSWVSLQELESDHAMTTVLETIWREIQTFCQLSA